MRIGLNGSNLISVGASIDAIVEQAVQAEADGLSSYWLAQLTVPDALTVLGAVGRATSTIELGTAVIPTWTRHPLMLAGQALTTQEMCGGRLVVGIGLAHKVSVEGTLRIPFDRPAHHMDEYLSVLLPALRDRAVDATGDTWSAFAEGLGRPDVPAPSVMLAAMGPRMLEMAGDRADGTILWLAGPGAVADHLAPALRAAAEAAGRPEPRIVVSVPVCVTDDAEQMRGMVGAVLGGYNDLPSYRGVMDHDDADGPADVSLIGDEATVRAGIEAYAEAGVTDFTPVEFTTGPEQQERTRALLVESASV